MSAKWALLLAVVASVAVLAVITVNVGSDGGAETVLAEERTGSHHMSHGSSMEDEAMQGMAAHKMAGAHKMADGTYMADEDMVETEGYSRTDDGSWELLEAQADLPASAQASAKAAARELGTKGQRAKAALKVKLQAQKKKTKEKSAKKLQSLAKRKKAELNKQKEGEYKRAVATITLKNTGLSHLKRVINRGKFRVKDRLLKARRKIVAATGASVKRMQDSGVGHTAIKAARDLRVAARAPVLKYDAWKTKLQHRFKNTAERAQKQNMKHAYKNAFRVMDSADIYHNAVTRVDDDERYSAKHAASKKP